MAAGVALMAAGGDEPPGEPPPLELGVVLADGPSAAALQAAERLYETGDRAGARARFEAVLAREPSSIAADVGAAVAAWPDGTVQRLEGLAAEHPSSGVVRLHLGLALYVEGDEAGAQGQWREAKRRDPDTPAAVRAEDLLHPEMPPGRPFFVPSEGSPSAGIEDLGPREQIAELERRAETGGVSAWLLYGSVLQRLGRPLSAQAAFDRAVELDPSDLAAQTAAAVVRFDKDDPSQAFSRLGPLASANPRSAVVRFHLGLMLLWLQQVDEARRQLGTARENSPSSIWGMEAGRLLARLDEATTS
jgi:tetratricopeptide (TPR) repeat protein